MSAQSRISIPERWVESDVGRHAACGPLADSKSIDMYQNPTCGSTPTALFLLAPHAHNLGFLILRAVEWALWLDLRRQGALAAES